MIFNRSESLDNKESMAEYRIENIKKNIKIYAILVSITGLALFLMTGRKVLSHTGNYSSNFAQIWPGIFLIFGAIYFISGIGILKFKERFRILLMWNMAFAVIYSLYENIFILQGEVFGKIVMHIPIAIFYAILFYFFNKTLVKKQFK